MLPAIVQSVEEIDSIRARLERDLDAILEERSPAIQHPEYDVGATPFYLAYHGRNNAELLRKIARVCRSMYPAGTECTRQPFSSERLLRIGFVSAYFHTHSVGRTTFGLIHDLPRDRFQVHAEIELDVDAADALAGVGRNVLDAGNAVDEHAGDAE